MDAPVTRAENDALIVASMPNQFQVVANPARIQLLDKSDLVPARGDFAERVVRVAELISAQNALSYSAVGLNFDVKFPSANLKPSAVILERFIKPDAPGFEEYGLTGASVRLWYMARDLRHLIYFEPRGNSVTSNIYHAHINVQLALAPGVLPPAVDWMVRAIDEEYTDFLKVTERALFG